MSVNVCGFDLPEEIARLAGNDWWTTYTEVDRLPRDVVERVFGEAPDATWTFYSVDEARAETEAWRLENDPEWLGVAPDDIEATSSVLIGDLGYDRPFALDFRSDVPVVRFMTIDARWVQVADSAAGLLEALGIDGSLL